MIEIGRKTIGKIILFIAMLIFIIFFMTLMKSSTITSIKRIGKQQNYNMEKEPIQCQLEQSIEKYVNIEENRVLLQQKIVVNSNKEKIKREREILQIKVPEIQEKKPTTIEILANGVLLENTKYNYDIQNNQINVEIAEENIGTYKIIYQYDKEIITTEDIQLSTRAYTKFENEEEIETQDEKTITIMPIGEKVSIRRRNYRRSI